jgi:hypothetical protein
MLTLAQRESHSGILEFYQDHPDEMKKDKALFQTWSAALRMADFGPGASWPERMAEQRIGELDTLQ